MSKVGIGRINQCLFSGNLMRRPWGYSAIKTRKTKIFFTFVYN